VLSNNGRPVSDSFTTGVMVLDKTSMVFSVSLEAGSCKNSEPFIGVGELLPSVGMLAVLPCVADDRWLVRGVGVTLVLVRIGVGVPLVLGVLFDGVMDGAELLCTVLLLLDGVIVDVDFMSLSVVAGGDMVGDTSGLVKPVIIDFTITEMDILMLKILC